MELPVAARSLRARPRSVSGTARRCQPRTTALLALGNPCGRSDWRRRSSREDRWPNTILRQGTSRRQRPALTRRLVTTVPLGETSPVRPSGQVLESAVDQCDPGRFQRLAEAYARLALPHRFRDLKPSGRNARGQTTKGWPDAYAIGPHGQVDLLEATRDVANWRRHLRADIARVERVDRGRVHGFMFVTWAPDPGPLALAQERSRLRACGIDDNNLTFVFRQQLISDLAQGRHALTWLELLRIPVSPFPFVDVRRAPIYGTPSREFFAPTPEEYATGAVHRASVADSVVTQLAKSRIAMVRGRGAAGKTSLGALLGLQAIAEGQPAYYLALSTEGSGYVDGVAAVNALVSRADDGVLFVLDDVHRDENLASILVDAWRQIPYSSTVLLLSRAGEPARRESGLASPLTSLIGDSIELVVTEAGLAGTVARLHARLGADPAEVPSNVQLFLWRRVFGGDLIAFSAAYAYALEHGHPLQLGPEDARSYVQDRYLTGLADRQRNALLAVADWSAMELPRPDRFVDRSELGEALKRGVVERAAGGYATVHPGVGELLLAGANVKPGSMVETDAMALDIADFMGVIQRQGEMGRRAQARRALGSRVNTWADVLQAFASQPRRSHKMTKLFREALETRAVEPVSDPHQLRQTIATVDGSCLLRLLVAANSGGLAGFREAVREAAADLSDSEKLHVAAGISAAIREQLEDLPLTLRHVHERLPSVLPRLAKALANDGTLHAYFAAKPSITVNQVKDLTRAGEASTDFARAMALERARPGDGSVGGAFANPTAFYRNLEWARDHDETVYSELIRVVQAIDWPARVQKWANQYPKALRELHEWARTREPEVADGITTGLGDAGLPASTKRKRRRQQRRAKQAEDEAPHL